LETFSTAKRATVASLGWDLVSCPSSATNPRYHLTENGHAEANNEADEDDMLLPKTEEKEFKIPEGALRDCIGFGDMNVVAAGVVAVCPLSF
jgi:hypothetical protein